MARDIASIRHRLLHTLPDALLRTSRTSPVALLLHSYPKQSEIHPVFQYLHSIAEILYQPATAPRVRQLLAEIAADPTAERALRLAAAQQGLKRGAATVGRAAGQAQSE
jgi:thioredoxin-like negative regulator of GroEL